MRTKRITPRSRLVAAALAFGLVGVLCAQRSPFNGLSVRPLDSTGHYRFIVSGHFYGNGLSSSGFPAVSLLANLDTINTLGAAFMLSTGDMFIDAKADRLRYTRTFFSKLAMPLFNAVGNHDVQGDYYTKLYGATSGSFDIGPDRVLILDTERDDSGINGEQLDMLIASALEAEAGRIRNIFILGHRPIWSEGDPRYAGLFLNNTRSLVGGNFATAVYPLLQRMAKTAHVYWFSGSLGGQAPSSFFVEPHAPNITFIQSAVRDEPRDALLVADVTEHGVVLSGLSLTGRAVRAPEQCTASWWREQRGGPKPFNWRMLPYHVRTIVLHRAFWCGVLAAFSLIALVWLVRRRRT